MELIIQKAVELGVYEIIPVAMKNCVVKLDAKKAAAKTARWQGIAPLIEEWQPAFLVVGVPRMGDGTPSTLTARCERFARQLGGRFRKKVFTVDERFSSVEVSNGRERIDDKAAAVILEQFFREVGAASDSSSLE